VFKIYYENQNIKAITRKKLNYDFIIDDQLSKSFIMGLKKPCEYLVYNNKIYKIDDLDFLKIDKKLINVNNNITSNSIKIVLFENNNSIVVELTDKHKLYVKDFESDFLKIIGQAIDEELLFDYQIPLDVLIKDKQYKIENVNIKEIEELLCSKCSLNVFYLKAKTMNIIPVNSLIDKEKEYNNTENKILIEIYKNKNNYSFSFLVKDNILPNFDIDYWIVGIVDHYDKNKLYQWLKIPIKELLEKKEYHTGFKANKRLKKFTLIGMEIFENTGVQWK
jgi:hypothetical protein